MIPITFLSGSQPNQTMVKTYSTNVADEVLKVSDYNAGKWFRHTTEQAESLLDVHKLLIRYGNGEYVRVHGAVSDRYQNQIIRKSTSDGYLYEPQDGVRLFNIDIDGKSGKWRTDPSINMRNRSEVQAAVNQALKAAGLGFLLDYDFIFMWSQSAWTPDPLRCHLYWVLDKGISLQFLRDFGLAFNKINNENLLDIRVWVAAQPDFIGRRRVTGGLKEIFQRDAERILYMDQGGLEDTLPTKLLEDFATSTIEEAEKDNGGPLTRELPGSWQKTIDLCGTESPEGTINGWAFRAAAQLVQEKGKQYTIEHLGALATEMHERAWIAIARNAQGSRGDKNDQNTYCIARFRQYLKSACDRRFGNDGDASFDMISNAVDVAVRQGDIGALFSRDALLHANRLLNAWPARWAEISVRIKRELKGVVSIGEYRAAVKKACKNHRFKPGGEGAEGGPDDVGGGVRIAQKVITQFTWIRDQQNNLWAALPSEQVGGYQMFSLSGNNLSELFFYMGQQLSEGLPDRFGITCLKYVLGCVAAQDSDFLASDGVLSAEAFQLSINRHDVCKQRSHRIGDTVLWDLGAHEGVWKVLVITKTELEIINRAECLERYNVIWLTHEQAQPRFVDLQASEHDVDLLWKYILVGPDFQPSVVGWLVSVLFCSGTQFTAELTGQHNSGKSHGGDVLRDLTDPLDPLVFDGRNRERLENQDKKELVRSIVSNGVIYMDNISGLNQDMQNLLCQLATGASYPLRIMYTSAVERLWLKKPVILTALSEVVTATDLSSRTIRISFMRNAAKKSVFSSDAELFSSWLIDRPKILGGLARICQKLLASDALLAGRRGTYQKAVQAMMGEEAGAEHLKIEELKTRLDSLLSSPFCLGFGGFVQSEWSKLAILDSEVQLTHQDWLQRYGKWLQQHWGKVVTLRTQLDKTIKTELNSGGDKSEKALPQTPRGFSALLNKYATELELVLGIQCSETRGKYKERLIQYGG